MKKILLFLMFALFCIPWAANAQSELTVYEGTDANSYVPFYGSYADTQGAASECVFPSDELDAMTGGQIIAIKFYITSSAAAAWTGTHQVYVGEVDATTLTGITGPSAFTVVKTASFDATGTVMTITFDEPYTYGGGNLLIGTYVSVAGNWKSCSFAGVNQTENTGWYRTSSSASGSAAKFLPKTTFTYTPGSGDLCLRPAIAVSGITHNEATLTIGGGSGTYNVQYKLATDENWIDVASNTTETSLTLSGLVPLRTYEVQAQSVCDGGATSDWKTASFSTTAQAELVGDAWSDDFEGEFGWELVNGAFTNAWTVGTAASNSGTKGLYVSNDDGTTNAYTNTAATMAYATKLLNFTEGKYDFAYNWMANGESTWDFLRVALVPAPVTLTAGTVPSGFSATALPTGWIAVDGGSKLNGVTTWQSQSVSVNVPTGNYYLVMAWRNDGSGGTNPPAAVDNVSITRVACAYDVEDLSVDNVTTNSATLTWTAGEAGQWQVAFADNADFENATEEIVSAATYNMTDLQPSTVYYAKVRAYCGGEEFGSWSNVFDFATKCEAIPALGYSENFDSYTAGNNVLPTCWSYINATTNSTYAAYPRVYANSSYSTYANTAPNCLYFYSYGSSDPQPQYAILPEMTGLAGLQVTLMAKGYNATSTLKIGTMSDPTDVATFAAITEQALTTSYQQFEYVIPADAPGNYLAFMIDAAPSGYNTRGVYVDDISIAEPPACPKPTDLTVTGTTTTTATLSWTAVGNETIWQIMLNGDEENLIEANSNPFTVENLTLATSYTAKVRAYCSADDQSEWGDEVNFTTKCEAITITEANTFSEDFEGYTGVAYNSNGEVPTCWDKYSTGSVAPHIIGGTGSYVYVHEGTNALTFYGSGYCYAAMPEFANALSELEINFWMQTESATNGTLTLGYITAEDENYNTFTEIATYENSYGSMSQRTTDLNNVPAEATRLVLRWYYSGQWSCCIDDVEVTLIPSCVKPTALECTATTTTTATLSWTAGADETAWQIMLNGDEENLIMANSNPFTVEGLTAATAYTAKVRAYCGADDQSDWSNEVNFTTDCDVIVVDVANPFTEDFEGDWTPLCWESIPSSSYNWSRNTYQHHSGSASAYSGYYGPVYLVMPDLQLGTDGDAAKLTFWSYNTYVSDYEKNSVVLLDGENEIELWSPESVAQSWEETTIDLTAYKGQTISIAFKYEGNNAHGWYVDDVDVTLVPPCGIVLNEPDYMWEETFESYTVEHTDGGFTNYLPDCWTLVKEYTGASPDLNNIGEGVDTLPQVFYYPSFDASTGNQTLRMKFHSLLAMPELDESVDMSRLHLSMWVRQPQTYYHLQVGVLTDLTDDSTFEPLVDIDNESTNMEQFELDFSRYQGEGRYIAFKNLGGSSSNPYCTQYLDDIVLTYNAAPAACGISALAYDESFEGYTTNTGATGVEPDCWEVIDEISALDFSTKPQLYAGFNTTEGGNYTLRMLNRCVYAMPELSSDIDVNTLTMTFSLRQPKAVYRLQVGVLDADNNFVLVEEIDNASADMEDVRVDFTDYTGNGHRIAFRNVLNGRHYKYSYNYLDDIHIDLTTNMPAPEPTKSISDMTDGADEYLNRIAVYPNPTTGMLHIDAVDVQKVECYNQMGKLVGVYDNVNELNISELANGVYTLRITVPQGVTMRKVVKR